MCQTHKTKAHSLPKFTVSGSASAPSASPVPFLQPSDGVCVGHLNTRLSCPSLAACNCQPEPVLLCLLPECLLNACVTCSAQPSVCSGDEPRAVLSRGSTQAVLRTQQLPKELRGEYGDDSSQQPSSHFLWETFLGSPNPWAEALPSLLLLSMSSGRGQPLPTSACVLRDSTDVGWVVKAVAGKGANCSPTASNSQP